MSLTPTTVIDSKGRELSTNVDPATGKRMSLRRPSGGYKISAATVGGSLALANQFTSGKALAGRPKSPTSTPRNGRQRAGSRSHVRAPIFRNVQRVIVPLA